MSAQDCAVHQLTPWVILQPSLETRFPSHCPYLACGRRAPYGKLVHRDGKVLYIYRLSFREAMNTHSFVVQDEGLNHPFSRYVRDRFGSLHPTSELGFRDAMNTHSFETTEAVPCTTISQRW